MSDPEHPGDMHVEESGTPGLPAIVFIHGAGQSGRVWREHMASLTDFHCLAPDLAGFGRSNQLAWVPKERVADLIDDLIERHVPAKRASLVGVSAGGLHIHALLDRHPDRVERAVLDGAPPYDAGRAVRAFMRLVVVSMAAFATTRPLRGYFQRTHDPDDLRAASRLAMVREFAQCFGTFAAFDAPCPTLLVAGEQERLVRPTNAAMAELMPHGEARFVPGLGHVWQRAEPDLHIRMVEAWVSGQALPSELRREPTPSPEAIERVRAMTRRGRRSVGYRRQFWSRLFGEPRGVFGWVGARVMGPAMKQYTRAMAAELLLQPDDELLDVGCGSGRLLAEHAAHVRYVAGLDISEIQVGMARERLSDRIAAGTADIDLGDAADLPWDDGRFSVVTSLEVLKHIADPEGTLREMHRVLRPGGRAVFTMGEYVQPGWGATDESGARNAWGVWNWSDADAQRLVEEAGFVDVTLSVLPVAYESRLVHATKPVVAAAVDVGEATELQEAAAT